MPEYQLINPSSEIRNEAKKYLERAQKNSRDPSSAFVPTGIGILIFREGHRFFSIRDVESGGVYDLTPLEREITSAETAGVSFCGITHGKIGDFKFLTHGGGLKPVQILTERAIDLIVEQGGVLPRQAEITVCYNYQNEDSGRNDLQGYRQGIEGLLRRRGLVYKVNSYMLDYYSAEGSAVSI